MPVPTIFLIKNKEIFEMKDQPYKSEDLLQQLLADFPGILAGDQMNASAPVRWLLIKREAGVPGEEGGSDRFSVDHLFVDQNGVPTLVEVKRSTDTRIRREVVAQMLDYAANAVRYWPVETLQEWFEETCREQEPTARLRELLGGDADDEDAIARFWETVETNLRAGRLRLIFAADEIPPELKRIIEFLDEQMNPTEVLGIEIRQYVGPDVRTLVPSVVRSSKREGGVPVRPALKWDQESFLTTLLQRRGSGVADIAKKILEWASQRGLAFSWGRGRIDGSCFIGTQEGIGYYPVAMWTSGSVQMQLQTLQQRSVPPERVEGFLSELRSIPNIKISPNALKYPEFDIASLKEPEALTQFLTAIGSLMEEIRKATSSAAATTATQ